MFYNFTFDVNTFILTFLVLIIFIYFKQISRFFLQLWKYRKDLWIQKTTLLQTSKFWIFHSVTLVDNLDVFAPHLSILLVEEKDLLLPHLHILLVHIEALKPHLNELILLRKQIFPYLPQLVPHLPVLAPQLGILIQNKNVLLPNLQPFVENIDYLAPHLSALLKYDKFLFANLDLLVPHIDELASYLPWIVPQLPHLEPYLPQILSNLSILRPHLSFLGPNLHKLIPHLALCLNHIQLLAPHFKLLIRAIENHEDILFPALQKFSPYLSDLLEYIEKEQSTLTQTSKINIPFDYLVDKLPVLLPILNEIQKGAWVLLLKHKEQLLLQSTVILSNLPKYEPILIKIYPHREFLLNNLYVLLPNSDIIIENIEPLSKNLQILKDNWEKVEPFFDKLAPHLTLLSPHIAPILKHIEQILPFTCGNFVGLLPYLNDLVPRLDQLAPHCPLLLPHLDDLLPYMPQFVLHLDDLLPHLGKTIPHMDALLHNLGWVLPYSHNLLKYQVVSANLGTVGALLPKNPKSSKLKYHYQKRMELYQKLFPKPLELLQNPEKEFVINGVIQIWSYQHKSFQERQFFFFDDYIILASTVKGENEKLQLEEKICLLNSSMKIENTTLQNFKYCFKLSVENYNKVFICKANSEEEKKKLVCSLLKIN